MNYPGGNVYWTVENMGLGLWKGFISRDSDLKSHTFVFEGGMCGRGRSC